ncbi:MAG: penicillin-binding transpeptidase domain-containing protein, partial [Pseudomonadota bacterium]
QNFRVLLTPENTDNIPQTVAGLEQIIPLTDSQERELLKEIQQKKNQPFTPIEVIDNLSWDDFAAVKFHAPRLKGITSEVGATRYYPDGAVVAPVVGHVGSAEQRDLDRASGEEERRLYLQPGFKLGKLGLEASHDEALRGVAGSKTVEINAAGRVISENENQGDTSTQGSVLALTLDAELQRHAHQVLGSDYKEYPEGTEEPHPVSASAVVMDTFTGDILVMASTPSFNPNDFARRIDAKTLRELKASPLKPLLCKPLSGAYPPGSTFKLLTAIAAEEQGIDPNTRHYCNGGMNYGGRRFNCWKRTGHGSMNMVDAIKHSCDVYFWQLATRVDIDHIADVARRYGLGQTYDLGIKGEVAG